METNITTGGSWRLRWDTFKHSMTERFPHFSSLRYFGETGERDLRIDFLRGMVMTVLLLVHFEFYSWYDMLVWERVGLISGAEGFVILSGLVVGMVYKRKAEKDGFKAAAFKMVDRAAQLYRVNLFIVFSVFLISLIPGVDSHLLTHYIDEGDGTSTPLFPSPGSMPPVQLIGHLLMLKSGPHYTQILGLYVVLLMAAPAALWLMRNGKTGLMLGLSFIAYFVNHAYPSMPTDAQFEYAFPLLSWQVLFFSGMAIGFHREKIAHFASVPMGRIVIGTAFVVFLACLFIAQNNPNPNWPEWSKLHFISEDNFEKMYWAYFAKDKLQPLRLVNYAAALIVAYALLTRFWRVFEKSLGKFFIPLGQASLYVFVIHLFLVLTLSNLHIVNMGNNFLTMHSGNVWLNTALHTGILFMVWYMVKKKFLFRWIPR